MSRLANANPCNPLSRDPSEFTLLNSCQTSPFFFQAKGAMKNKAEYLMNKKGYHEAKVERDEDGMLKNSHKIMSESLTKKAAKCNKRKVKQKEENPYKKTYGSVSALGLAAKRRKGRS